MDKWLPHLDLVVALIAIAISIYALYAQRVSENRQRVLAAKQRKSAVTIAILSEMSVHYSTVRRELLAAKNFLDEGIFVPSSAAPTFPLLKIEDDRMTRELLASVGGIPPDTRNDQLLASRMQIVADAWKNLARSEGVSDLPGSEMARKQLVTAIDELVGQLDAEIEGIAEEKTELAGE